jgi:DNA ligase 1
VSHIADFSRFQQFAELCQRLTETGSKLKKRAQMAEYLRSLSVDDAGLASLYLAGSPFPETDGRGLSVGGASLSRAVEQLSGASQPEMHAAYRRHGDLGGAAEDLLASRKVSPTLLLSDVATAFADIAAAQ